MERIRQEAPLVDNVARLLTMVACESLETFVGRLAELDRDSKARALVRITDMRSGSMIRELSRRINAEKGSRDLTDKLTASVGYYDVQGTVSITDASVILRHAAKFVPVHALTTSTCFIGPPDAPGEAPIEVTSVVDSPILSDLKREHEGLRNVMPELAQSRCLNPLAYELAAEAVNKFERLQDTTLIPGSRLLIWSCRDAIICFRRECADHLAARSELAILEKAKLDDDFHLRQRDYAEFFGATCDELDRRVSLSLAAHTRFFPCSIEAPLKVVGALDMASRLVAASFRCYQCRESSGLLQIFSAKSNKPTQFFPFRPRTDPRDPSRPYPTMVLTTFSPRLVRHFYMGLFTVLHEVAQCIIQETIDWPSFTALVFTQSFLERIAVISMLVAHRSSDPTLCDLPRFVRNWAADFLTREIAASDLWRVKPTRIGPAYFAAPDLHLADSRPTGSDWGRENLWRSQFTQWQVSQVTSTMPDSTKACFQLYRDARLAAEIDRHSDDENFRWRWAQEVYGDLSSIPILPVAAGQAETEIATEQARKRYHIEVGTKLSAIESWTGACAWSEFLELASLVPFLRLFEEDGDAGDLQTVVVGLIQDYWVIWHDSESREAAYDAARRFVVALAAMELCREHRCGNGLGQDCQGTEANAAIAAAVARGAAALNKLAVSVAVDSRAEEVCRLVWQQLAGLKPCEDSYGRQITEPLVVHCMVRFLVRLLHVYRIDGPNVIPARRDGLAKCNKQLRQMFVARSIAGNEVLPGAEITRLWSLQYLLSDPPMSLDYLFGLDAVVKAELHEWTKTPL